MTRALVVLMSLASLAACGGKEKVEATQPVASVTTGTFLLDVYREGDRVRVQRVHRGLESESEFARTAIPIAERATGCTVDRDTLSGGPGVLRAKIDC